MGYSRKYTPPSPYGRHRIGYLKISGFPKGQLIQNLEEFQNFAKIWMVFLEFWLKFTNFGGYLWISNHTHWAFLTGFAMSSMGGGGGGRRGRGWVFSGIAQYDTSILSANEQRRIFHLITSFVNIVSQVTPKIFQFRMKLIHSHWSCNTFNWECDVVTA